MVNQLREDMLDREIRKNMVRKVAQKNNYENNNNTNTITTPSILAVETKKDVSENTNSETENAGVESSNESRQISIEPPSETNEPASPSMTKKIAL